MLAELEFARNPSPTRFLQFVVSETLAGRGERLKAYAIATSALGRSENFDPQSDSIVRVQAVRLRAMLNSYYAGSGANDEVRIAIPVGTYQAKFAYASHSSPPPVAAPTPLLVAPNPDLAKHEPTVPVPEPSASEIVPVLLRKEFFPTLRPLLAPAAVTVSALVVVLIALAVWIHSRGAATPALSLDHPPVIFVDLPQASPPTDATVGALRFLESLKQGLSALEYVSIRVAAPHADAGRADYILTTRFVPVGPDQADVDLFLARASTGDVLWSRQLQAVQLNVADNGRQASQLAANAVGGIDDAVVLGSARDSMTLPEGRTQGLRMRNRREGLLAQAPGAIARQSPQVP